MKFVSLTTKYNFSHYIVYFSETYWVDETAVTKHAASRRAVPRTPPLLPHTPSPQSPPRLWLTYPTFPPLVVSGSPCQWDCVVQGQLVSKDREFCWNIMTVYTRWGEPVCVRYRYGPAFVFLTFVTKFQVFVSVIEPFFRLSRRRIHSYHHIYIWLHTKKMLNSGRLGSATLPMTLF